MSAVLFVVFIIMLVLAVPIATGLGMSSIFAFMADGMPLDMVAGNMHGSICKFALLAIPFFILAGNIMEKTGISGRLIDFANSMVGHLKGGLAMVCIIVSCFFAAISGSGPATVAALGAILIPAMVKVGYKPAFAAALMAAGGAIGIVIPPSIQFVVYGSIANNSIADLFKAGILPGILIGVSLVIGAMLVTSREAIELQPKANAKQRLLALKDAFWGLLMPVIILGGIYGGIFTPTEAAAVAVVYGLFVGAVIYRSLSLKTLLQILKDSASTTGVVMLIVAAASLFAYVLTIDGMANRLSQLLIDFSGGNSIKFFVVINIIMLIAGCFLETTAAFYILTPIFLPVALQLGVNPTHLGCVMVVNMAIGLFTPPVGVNLYVACGIAHVSVKEISKKILPLILANIVALLIITYVPALSLAFV